jgi:two-component system OmpR family response regulator
VATVAAAPAQAGHSRATAVRAMLAAMSEAGRRILVVDDEPSITDAVSTALRYEGFDTREAGSGRAAEREIDEFRPDLIVLDVMLPDLDGFEIARRLRDGRHRTPVIFLTAKDATEDKLAGLAIGDDYVTKPFSLAEIVARVRAVLRRAHGEDEEQGVLRFADVVLNEETREVWRHERPVELTPTEFNLLRFFMLNPRRVLTKRQILDNVWHYDFGGDPNVVETYVSYLRKKLDGGGPPLIQTIRLVGYALREPAA